MGFLSRHQLFLAFVIVTLVDATTLVRAGHSKLWSVPVAVCIGVLMLDAWVLWKLAWLAPAEKPDPSYAVVE